MDTRTESTRSNRIAKPLAGIAALALILSACSQDDPETPDENAQSYEELTEFPDDAWMIALRSQDASDNGNTTEFVAYYPERDEAERIVNSEPIYMSLSDANPRTFLSVSADGNWVINPQMRSNANDFHAAISQEHFKTESIGVKVYQSVTGEEVRVDPNLIPDQYYDPEGERGSELFSAVFDRTNPHHLLLTVSMPGTYTIDEGAVTVAEGGEAQTDLETTTWRFDVTNPEAAPEPVKLSDGSMKAKGATEANNQTGYPYEVPLVSDSGGHRVDSGEQYSHPYGNSSMQPSSDDEPWAIELANGSTWEFSAPNHEVNNAQQYIKVTHDNGEGEPVDMSTDILPSSGTFEVEWAKPPVNSMSE